MPQEFGLTDDPGERARTGERMNQDGHVRGPVSRALLLCVALWGAAGCSSTQAAHQGTGGSGAKSSEAIAQPVPVECNQTDSTTTCCLKKNPGQYERCGAVAPRQAPKQTPKQEPKNGPDKLPPLTDLSPEEIREREKKCRDYWEQCIALGGEYEKRGQHGQTICRACYQQCRANGHWPERVNDFQCLGRS